MNYTEIKTSEKMNEVVKEQLIFRGDHLSKYAAKRIEELEQLLLCGVNNCAGTIPYDSLSDSLNIQPLLLTDDGMKSWGLNSINFKIKMK